MANCLQGLSNLPASTYLSESSIVVLAFNTVIVSMTLNNDIYEASNFILNLSIL